MDILRHLVANLCTKQIKFLGPQCPEGVAVSGRGLRKRIDLKEEILRRHNEYRADVRAGRTGLPATKCIPDLK